MEFAEHINRHYESLYRFAYRMLGSCETAEDVVQEVFLRMARNSPRNPDGESVRRWLFVVARNLCMSHLRRRAVQREEPFDVCPEVLSPGLNPAEVAQMAERSKWIKDAVAQLPPAMREVVILREYEGMNYAQIAEIAGCPLGTVRSRLARARQELRKRLQPLLEEL